MRNRALTLFFLASVFASAAGIAQTNGGFNATRPIATGGRPWTAASADLNHDGIPDIVTADGSTTTVDSSGTQHITIHGIAVLLGKGNGLYRPPVHYATSDSASFVCITDVDGDGNPDVVTASDDPDLLSPGGSVQVLRGNGDGTFGAAAKYAIPGAIAVSVSPVAYNGDGHVDLAVTTISIANPQAPPGTAILLNNGDGTFRLGPQSSVSSSGAALPAAASAASALPVSGYDGSPVASCTGDFNHDGIADVAVLTSTNMLDVQLGRSDGSYSYRAAYSVGAVGVLGGAGALSCVDLNKDGQLDLLTASPDAGVIIVYGKPGGTFNAESEFSLGTANIGVASVTGDFNRDGIPDIAVLNSVTGLPNSGPETIQILLGQGNGSFRLSPKSFATGVAGIALAVGDVNGDGKVDLVVEAGPEAGQNQPEFAVLLGNGDGTFKAPEPMGSMSLTFQQLPANSPPIYLADVNNDGKLDVITFLGVHLGVGDGTFGSAIPLPGTPDRFALADFNKNGKLDLVSLSDDRAPVVTVELGFGDGRVGMKTFSETLPFGDFDSNYLAVGRFTRDGNFGVVAGSNRQFYPDGTVLQNGGFNLLAGNGDGTLKDAVSYQVPLQLWSLTVGDFNGDGIDDVVAFNNLFNNNQTTPTASTTTNFISLYTSKGDGTLLAPVVSGSGNFEASNNIGNLPVADFNSDGALDIAGFEGRVATYEGVVMNSRGTNVTLAATPGTAKVGQPVALKCTVTGSFHFGGGFGSDTITFFDGGTALGTVKMVNGMATLNTSKLKSGSHSLTALFSGDSNYNAHRSRPLTVVITP